MKTIKLLVVGLIASGLFLSSCEQTENEPSNVSDDAIQSILSITDLYNTEDAEVATSDDGTKSVVENHGSCFELTIHPNEDGAFWPKSWTLEFDGECESFNGITRSGMIHVTLTDCWRNEGSLRTISFEDFYVNDIHLEGIKTIENTGLNDVGNMTWVRKMVGGKLTFDDATETDPATFISWDCERISERVEGGDTWLFRDDIYMVTGGGNGVNREGLTFTTEITNPLKYVFRCRFPVSGELTINIEGSETVVINFGDGECDKIATQTIGSNEPTEIELGLCKN
ncbi:MAG: hypothetical protein ABFS35_13755 [Bacteroidota bacterium]